MAEQKDSRVHAIRVPVEISNEIQKLALSDDRSMNYIINKILKAHLEQEAQKEHIKK